MKKGTDPNNMPYSNNPIKNIPDFMKGINPKSEALIVVIRYGIFGVLWILLSDKILDIFVDNIEVYKVMQIYKGWFFVLLTMILLFVLINKRASRIKNASDKTVKAYEELKALNEEQFALKEELTYQKDLIQNIIEGAPVLIVIWNEEFEILKVNPFGKEVFEYKEEELIGKVWINMSIASENGLIRENLLDELTHNGELKKYESSFTTKKGKKLNILWSSSVIRADGEKKTIVSIGMDITERKKHEESIKHMAYYDSLTGLPNRDMFRSEIEIFIENSKGKDKFAIAFLDIDNFKYVNDTMGHSIGDDLLKYISCRLSSAIKYPDIAARLGGDEFGILFKDFGTEENLMKKLNDIQKAVGNSWNSNNREFFISMSIGAAIYPNNGDDAVSLLKNSDIAMNVAKKEGKNKALLYKEDIHEDIMWHIHMSNKLQKALDNKEFDLYYQPQIELDSGRIVGMEALVRWIHPTEGFISPAEFIPVAEETGQIYLLEQRILKHALKQKKRWEEEGFIDITLSINLSGKSLISNSNFKNIEAVLSDFDVDYTKVVIEITETAAISNFDIAIERLNRLKNKGLKITLDDFGTGYSSINYLKKLPIDIIKLDKSYVGSISKGNRDASIVKFILSLAYDLNLTVIAEGIETNEQLEYFKNINCHMGQGFLISMPSPAEKIRDMLYNNLNKYGNV